jgi:hypothetical protein
MNNEDWGGACSMWRRTFTNPVSAEPNQENEDVGSTETCETGDGDHGFSDPESTRRDRLPPERGE